MHLFNIVTEVNAVSPEWKIDHETEILTIGSCFAEVIGSQLSDAKFPVLNNPFGTVFNPLSIIKILDLALDKKAPNPALFFQNQDKIWLHHDFHSSWWSSDKDDLTLRLTRKLDEIGQYLIKSKVLIITLGTAYAYRHRGTNQLIGNCHKVPADQFVKELLHQDQIMIAFEQLIFRLLSVNRNLKIVLTVSPVRHTKDTLILNQVSKSTLRLVCHKLSEKFRHIEYFPAYEIMVDELRDYRFYKEDLIHPGNIAEEYIFDVFSQGFLTEEARVLIREWSRIKQMIAHRNIYGNTESQFKLLNKVKELLKALSGRIDVSTELADISKRIEEFPTAN